MSDQAESTKPTIECAPDGPYVVKSLENFTNSKGESLASRPVMALCRCGASENKPFCDGAHKAIGFSGERLPDRTADRRDDYRGKEITIHDNRGGCSHAGFCTERLPAVWRMKVEPWIDPEGAAVEAIVETIEQCPSGALSYSIGGTEHRDQEREPTIELTKDGPYAVTGGVELLQADWGQEASREHYALCRCGQSKNKPFCDGAHWHVGFHHDE